VKESWCPSAGQSYNICATNYTFGNYFYWLEASWPGPFRYVRGDEIPFQLREQFDEYGDELREFVVKDLFNKALSPRFDGLVFLAELDETLVGLRDLLLGSLKSLFKAKEMRRNLGHIVMNPHELWLWYRYMLMPAILSAEDLLRAMKADRIIDRVQDGDRSKDPVKITGRAEYGPQWGLWWIPLDFETEYTYGLGGALDISKRVDPHYWGFSNIDILRATWERIPFSFVADWFVNVGDYLTNLRKLEIVYAQSYATYAIDAKTKISYPDHTEWNEHTIHSYRINRIVNLEPPRHPLIDKRWNNVLRSLDLISLTIGTLKGVLQRRR
jgi:hypothetical protein